MKKIIALASILAFSSVAVAKGGFHDGTNQAQKPATQQGFYDESLVVKTAKDALAANDDTPVALEGYIVKQIDKDEFIFKDATGEIQIDVNKRAWKGQTITPQDKIEIRGKVDKEWSQTEVDVKEVFKK